MREAIDDAGQKGLNVNMRATLTAVSIDFLNRYLCTEKSFYFYPKILSAIMFIVVLRKLKYNTD